MPTSERDIRAAVAVTRFGLGAAAGDINTAKSDPAGYLRDQIRASGADLLQPPPESSAERLFEVREVQVDRRQARRQSPTSSAQNPESMTVPTMGGSMMGEPAAVRDPVQIAARLIRQNGGRDFVGRIRLAATTPAGFRERWAMFWCNHFTVTAAKLVTAVLIGPYEQEAIRPAVFGSFEQLLTNATFHPAMLLYLDQAQSVGPGSIGAGYVRRQLGGGGLNENLAREILELHTVGLAAGYTQTDVTEFAKAMTGWSVGGLRESSDRQGRTVFRQMVHEPGRRTIMGQTYPDSGQEQARAVLHDLARSPHTARHIAFKIARHFVADDPPQSLVSQLEQAYLSSNGRLDRVAEALISAPESWDPTARKFKTPYEFLVSSWRAAGTGGPRNLLALAPTLTGMGQQPFNPPSPKGWPEEAEQWAAPDAVVRRMTWADSFANSAIGDMDPMALAHEALGGRLNLNTQTAISRAESRAEGLAILLMSPEFQRR